MEKRKAIRRHFINIKVLGIENEEKEKMMKKTVKKGEKETR